MEINRKESSSIQILLFAVLLIAVIITAAIFLISLFSQNEQTARLASQQSTDKKLNKKTAEQEVKEEYKKKVEQLQEQVKNGKLSSDEKMEKVSKFIFKAKVPGKYLDSHLQAAIKLRNLKKDPPSGEKELRVQLSSLLSQLLQK